MPAGIGYGPGAMNLMRMIQGLQGFRPREFGMRPRPNGTTGSLFSGLEEEASSIQEGPTGASGVGLPNVTLPGGSSSGYVPPSQTGIQFQVNDPRTNVTAGGVPISGDEANRLASARNLMFGMTRSRPGLPTRSIMPVQRPGGTLPGLSIGNFLRGF